MGEYLSHARAVFFDKDDFGYSHSYQVIGGIILLIAGIYSLAFASALVMRIVRHQKKIDPVIPNVAELVADQWANAPPTHANDCIGSSKIGEAMNDRINALLRRQKIISAIMYEHGIGYNNAISLYNRSLQENELTAAE